MEHSLSDDSFSNTSTSCHSSPSCAEVQHPAVRGANLKIACVHASGNNTAVVPPLIQRFRSSLSYIHSNDVEIVKEGYCGEGSVSFVFKAMINGKEAAAKILRTDTENVDEDGFPSFAKNFIEELNIAELRLNHPNIMSFIGVSTTVFCDAEIPMILYEYVNGGSVQDVFERKSKKSNNMLWKPPPNISLAWCRQLTQALSHLHNLDTPLAHRDIKPANLLVSMDMQTLKLADFSLAKHICASTAHGEKFTSNPSIAGSLRYLAPEACQQTGFDLAKADVYSAALNCWSLVNGSRVFNEINDASITLLLTSQGLRPPTKQNQLGAVLSAAWDPNPQMRPTAIQLASQFEAMDIKLAFKDERQSSWGKKMISKMKGSFDKRSASLPNLRTLVET